MKRRARLNAVLMAIVMLISMLSGFADAGEIADECTHDITTWKRERRLVSCEAFNGMEHVSNYGEYYVETCNRCDEVVVERLESNYDLNGPHSFDQDGVCTACGYVSAPAPCAHAETRQRPENRNYTYTNKDGNSHSVSYDIYLLDVCVECEQVVSENFFKRGLSAAEPHAPYPAVIEERNHSYSDNNANAHRVTYDRWQYKYCYICASKYNESLYESGATRLEPHTAGEAVSESRRSAAVNANASAHSVRVDEYSVVRCTGCNRLLSETLAEEGTPFEEAHSFVGGECTECGRPEVCPHLHTTETRRFELQAVSPFDEFSHRTLSTLYLDVDCEDCGERVSRTLEDADFVDYIEHDPLTGPCTVCGYLNGCAHENRGTVTTDSDMTYTDITEDTHKMHSIRRVDVNCSDCGINLILGTPNPNYSAVENHIYISGVCACGALNPCAHANTSTQTAYTPESYAQLSVTAHTVNGTYVDTVVCTDCGDIISVSESANYSVSERHYIPIGANDCERCGYVCPHMPSVSEPRFVVDEYIIVDSTRHEARGASYTYYICSICGQDVSRQLTDENVTEQQYHEFDGWFCKYCGYNKCPHARTGVDREENRNVTYEYADAAAHSVIYDAYLVTPCRDCGNTARETLSEAGARDTAPHIWNAQRKCEYCGCDKPCSHINTSIASHSSVEGYALYNDTLHYTLVTEYDVTTCDDCGAEIRRAVTNANNLTTSAHVIENGVCTECGFVCEHFVKTHEDRFIAREYTPVDSLTHSALGDMLVFDVCVNCGCDVSSAIMTANVTQTQPHEFEGYFCGLCGYNNCPHEHPGTPAYEDRNDVYTRIDDVNHDRAFDRYLVYPCLDCGQTASETPMENDKHETLPHVWNAEDKCEYCGCDKPCAHEDVTVSPIYVYEGSVQYDVSVHTSLYTVYNVTICDDCGVETRRVVVNANFTTREFHTVENGVCTACGYGNSCAHWNAGYVYAYYNLSYTDITADTHTVHGIYRRYAQCFDCGFDQFLGTADPNYSAVAPHEYHIGACVCGALNPCEHENTTTTREYTPVIYTQYSDTRHTVAGTYVDVDTCDDCGKELSRSADMPYSEEEPHSMVGTACERCGFTCAHENFHEEELQAVTLTNPYSTTQHAHMGNITYNTVCDTCDAVLSSRPGQRNAIRYEDHVLENGECAICGYGENDCAHPSRGAAEALRNTAYAQLDGERHVYTYDIVEITFCDNCALVLDETFVRAGEPERGLHEFEDGLECVRCGYARPCAHENLFISDRGVVQLLSASLDPIDTSRHILSYQKYDVYLCLDCAARDVYREYGNVYYEFEDHTFDGDVCTVCKYRTGCTHAETVDRTCDYRATYPVVTDTYHTINSQHCEETVCASCGAVLSFASMINHTSNEPHKFSAGVCACGYVNPCVHNNCVMHDEVTKTSTWSVSSTQHCSEGYIVTTVTCEDCREVLDVGEPAEFDDLYEPHNIVGNECVDCDFRCAHENTYSYEQFEAPTYEPVDARTHICRGDTYRFDICNFCYTVVSTTLIDEDVERVENHTFENGECIHCHAANTCTHEGAEQTWYQMNNTTTVYTDEHTHTTTGERWLIAHCTNCGEETRSELADPAYSYAERHLFTAGRCTDCDYVSSCIHENTESDSYKAITSRVYRDSVYHTATYFTVTYTYCMDCGEELSSVMEDTEETTLQMHSYYRGKCDCGAVNACPHTETEPVTGYDNVIIMSYDADGHDIACDVHTYVKCTACGETIGHTVEKDERLSMPHQFILSVCDICGYVNTCAHENTESRSDSYSRSIGAYDETGHEVICEVYTATFCVSCDERLSARTVTTETVVKPHVYANAADGQCLYCAFVLTPDPKPMPEVPKDRLVNEPIPEAETIADMTMPGALINAAAQYEAYALESALIVTYEFVGIEKLLTDEELAVYETLTFTERTLVLLDVLGFGEEADVLAEELEIGLSPEAAALRETVAARIEALTEEESAEFTALITELFSISEAEDSSRCEIAVRVTIGDKAHIERFTFESDKTDPEWYFKTLKYESAE